MTTSTITGAVSLSLFYFNNPPSKAPFGPIVIGVY